VEGYLFADEVMERWHSINLLASPIGGAFSFDTKDGFRQPTDGFDIIKA
jgi:hypothetical protein